MLQVDSYIVYGANGVCRISDIRTEKLCGTKELYYVLSPIGGESSTIYVPVKNDALVAKMRRLLNREQIAALLRDLSGCEASWISDSRERGAYYADLFAKGDRLELLQTIRAIYLKQRELAESRKKLAAIDENALRRAEKIINDEFSVVLDIAPENVPGFIRDNLREAG